MKAVSSWNTQYFYNVSFSVDDPLVGPLSQQQSDDTDGPTQEVVDEERLQCRSDDEDT